MRVPVMDTHRVPLMPTTSARARLLLKQGKVDHMQKHSIIDIVVKEP